MNVLSLFDGMSCGQIALERANIKVDNYYASEIDKHAIKVTMSNYPNTIQLGSVINVHSKDLPKIDLLIGGSPCQGFSFAGKGLNFEDVRSKLFFEYLRLLKELKPKYFLLENVVMKKEYKDIISKYLDVEPIKINSSLVSAANRKRLYWTNIPNIKQPEDKHITFDDINQNEKNWISEERIEKIKKWKSQQQPLDRVIIVGKFMKLPCLTARGYNQYHSGMVVIKENNKYRYLGEIEAELAHNIPINYTQIVNNKERSYMIGNGWTVDVIVHIFKEMDINV